MSRVAANLGFGLGGALGGLVAVYGLNGFVVLFLANAVTYLIYVVILAVAVREDARPAPLAGGYRLLLRDRPFVRLALTNIAMIAVGWGVFTWVVPPYAREEIGASSRLIGLLLLANALTVVLAQIPVARLAEGRRRAVTMAVASLTFVAACLLVVGADLVGLQLRLRCAVRGADPGRRRRVLPHDGADAARRRPGAAGVARALHGDDRTFMVARPGAGDDARDAAAEHVAARAMLAAAGVALAAGLSALALEREVFATSSIRLTPRPADEFPRQPQSEL